MNNKKILKIAKRTILVIGAVFAVTGTIGFIKKKSSQYENEPEQKNPLEGKRVVFIPDENEAENADGVRGHLEAVGESKHHPGFYEKHVKRGIDIILSFGGLVLLGPVFALIAIAIIIDDPGPVLFTQKRMGQNKKYFKLHKFRSMKMCTPHDTPTHMLENPEQYITKVGKFLREHSLDELPQIWDIFIGNMSVIGPRPGLWNQDVLTAERDKYGANDVKPGLTGWAQINGRDELEIPEKAKLDGEYVEKISLWFDIQCFLGTVGKVAKDDSVVEGGTGEMRKNEDAVEDTKCEKECLVSVVIATYRRDAELTRALRSLMTQTYKYFEVVLVDDNADDSWNKKVAEIVTDFDEYLNIKYLVNEKNIGSAMSRNRAIEEATGAYITFLDDDDMYLSHKIENQLNAMEKEKAEFSITDLDLYFDNECLSERRSRFYIKQTDSNSLLTYHLLYHMTGTDTLMFKTSYLRKIGMFDPIDVGDEYYLMFKAITGNGKFAYVHQSDVKAYVHKGEGGLSSGSQKIEGENALFEFKKRHFSKLKRKEVRYVKTRHYAVLAFAYLRKSDKIGFVSNASKAFISSPMNCIKILSKR